ncbi:predicted protein [Histoplasma capsulatum G186AR]|uniref:Uncharacterized protein n=1 Tax=Ajellomyces capsulatus (strain G186AR / H82 / ATCC MYA-2454 / RMSCC 2432) TaxID=447093 RepID=C0NWQ4_AJECG|nr:uncharacterized protein HCBG_07584 [Histoplasma capsulatum G186AR]EEH04359.1 predicted protein [Histoplasma capsulatum G186AR]
MGRSTISRRERDGTDSLEKAKRQSGTRRGKKRRKRGAHAQTGVRERDAAGLLDEAEDVVVVDVVVVIITDASKGDGAVTGRVLLSVRDCNSPQLEAQLQPAEHRTPGGARLRD